MAQEIFTSYTVSAEQAEIYAVLLDSGFAHVEVGLGSKKRTADQENWRQFLAECGPQEHPNIRIDSEKIAAVLDGATDLAALPSGFMGMIAALMRLQTQELVETRVENSRYWYAQMFTGLP